MEHIKRIDRQLKYSGTMLKMYADTISVPNGNVVTWDFIGHNGAAAVLPVTADGRIVMVRQFRNALDRETLEIPAGGLTSPEESTYHAAVRELEEETGYKSENVELLVSVATAVAFCDENIDIYIARDLVASKQNLDEDEYIDVEIYSVEELTSMIYSGKIRDSKTVAAIMTYKDRYL